MLCFWLYHVHVGSLVPQPELSMLPAVGEHGPQPLDAGEVTKEVKVVVEAIITFLAPLLFLCFPISKSAA